MREKVRDGALADSRARVFFSPPPVLINDGDSGDRGVFSLGGSLGEDFSAEWIRAHTRDAHEILGKPFVLEEFGATGAGSGAVIDQQRGAGVQDVVGGGFLSSSSTLLSPYSARAERARRADVVAQYYRRVRGVEEEGGRQGGNGGESRGKWVKRSLSSAAPAPRHTVSHSSFPLPKQKNQNSSSRRFYAFY